MAELDIKDIWNKSIVRPERVEFPGIEHIEGARSRNVLFWLRVILTIEFCLNLVITPIAIYLEIQRGSWITVVFLIVVGVVYFLYFLFLILKLRAFDFSGDVKVSLTKIYNYLKFYLLHYKVVMFLSLYFGGFYGYYETASEKGQFIFAEHVWPLLLVTVIFVPVYLLFHFLINLIYGRKIKKLRKILEGLKEE
ncbi:hypothetical protein FNH22_24905 [Fulvivirga sp. M361]|uniref:hypothetical protein n=1 Tax=Fulvivirga sp. M361 TaxID=2594266 RepID=UPI00117AE851|nr:hypothetical protein [Fulvivirga sp. M361]TRX50895.1 hypothetical protein FNH22_24905 [Fulvivirga sp. M361]